ncbi:efflux transporter, outer membrane factor (OMF) lipoprotein, NodT family [Mesorhizobium albiziae]|uniref:Efflux transporter, outer membrane factor (OMF) lipoprotein, NodT family n=1 Tax=Neomesorhizobium albiziae TaxID=335020 RepID=A0A1I3ZQ99_9HYPH|nr:efflux transporter outer membrane subunit [Mesorhizobium albiziae]GLS32312.1 outer membrane efflux protein [Mesorhizobium albiziae]SFK46334.1 efflux transporter, outer membrane factor (OMF) lipoprotein, NodT family [Mesorhizobium albiziae]
MKLVRLIVPYSLVLLAGCSSLSSTYLRPELPAGPRWSTAAAAGAVQASADRWWLAFGDPNLDKLVGDVIGRNNDVLLAAARAYRTRLKADIAANALFPKLNGYLATGNNQPLDGKAATSSSASIYVSYEIDLWGKLAAQRDRANFEAHATAEDYEAARLTTIGRTIETYFRIAHANQSLASAESSLADVKQIQALVRTQMAGGAVSDLELREAEQKVETQAAAVSALKQKRLELRNDLTVLLNGAPNPVPEPQRLPRKKLPSIQAGLPADLLARRPDLRAAEARLRATLKTVDEKRASFYPPISLTGTLGTSSPQLLAFISNPVATLTADVALSFLKLKDMKLEVAVSRAEYEERVLEFRNALLTAFSDVAKALGARANYAEQVRRLRNALAAAQEVEQLKEARYRAGAISLREWLEAQESRRSAEVELANVRLDQLLNESLLYRALGGSAATAGPDRKSTAMEQRSKAGQGVRPSLPISTHSRR